LPLRLVYGRTCPSAPILDGPRRYTANSRTRGQPMDFVYIGAGIAVLVLYALYALALRRV